MVYLFLRFWVDLAMRVWFRSVYRHFKEELPADMPIIFACNHPNSAIDFMHVGLTVHKPVHVLVRADVFAKPLVSKILRGLWLMPVYRMRDGYSSLARNEGSFGDCYDLFDKNGMVHIFSEGICVQEKKVQPLKKGTARLALDYYTARGKDVAVIPVGVNYSVFRNWRNTVMLRFGKIIKASEYAELLAKNPATAYTKMTADLEAEMKTCVIEFNNFEDDNLAEKALMTLRMSRPITGEYWVDGSHTYFEEEQRLALKVESMKPEEFPAALQANANIINGSLEGFLSTGGSALFRGFKMAFILPLFALCSIPLLLPAFASLQLIKAKIKDKIFYTTVMVLASLLFYMLQLIIVTIVALSIMGLAGWWIPVLMLISTLVSIPLSDSFIVHWRNRKWWNKQSEAQQLLEEVRKLVPSPLRDSVKAA